MSTIGNIKEALQEKITESAKEQSLVLAQDAFPGPIQQIIGDYLNGVMIPLGSAASLKVSPQTRQLEVKATIGDAKLDLQGTADKAVITVSSTKPDLKGATITLTFKKDGDNVTLELDANMGDSLQWQIKDVWPTYLDWTPANKLAITKGNLDLSLSQNKDVDFTGTGSMLYNGSSLANGAIRVSYTDKKTGVLVGIVVVSWSPGEFWPPLKSLTFNNSGLVFSTLDAKSSSLVSLGLLPEGEVPAIGGDFDIKPGMVFFTSLKLDGVLKSISNFMGLETELDLFASYAQTTGALDLKATLKNTFGAGGKDIFQFNGLTLDWEDPTNVGGTITATAAGHFNPDKNTSIELDLSGSVKPSEGDFSVGFTLKDWKHPFGIETLTIEEATADFVVGAQAEGVTVQFGGAVKLQNPSDPDNEFELSLMAEVADFEVPTGIAFWMDADYEEMDLSEALNATFAVDLTPEHLKKIGEPELGDIVQVINDLIKIKQFQFWFVEGASLKKIGDHGPFAPGFGLNAEFDLFNQEDIKVSVVLDEKGSDPGYSGSADFKEEIKFGKVLDIAGWDPEKKQKLPNGPEFAISATKGGKVIEGVNDGKPVYFYTSAYLSFLDLLSAHIYGIVTAEGIFQFTEGVQAGTKVGASGAWAGETITIGVNPKTFEFDAGFSFDFGWKDVQWPDLELWGVTLIPSGTLPDFSVLAAMDVHASLTNFVIKGYFDFDFMGISLHWGSPGDEKTLLDLDLKDAITSISEIASKLLDELMKVISKLLEEAFDDVKKFLNWIGNQLSKFVDGVKMVAQILAKEFKKTGQDIVDALKSIGVAAATITDTLVNELGYAASEVEGWVKNAFDCAIESASNLLG